jgi:hypothetical protein
VSRDLLQRLDAMSPAQREALRGMLDTRGAEFNVYPLSYGQRQIWFLERMHGATPLYTVPYAFALRGKLDLDALNQAIATLVRRHEALRTVFFDVDGVPYQTILADMPFSVSVRTWRPQDADNADLVQRLVDANARRLFDLRNGPLINATVLTSGGDRHLLMLCKHHIISDGWSMGVFFRELQELYAAALEGREPQLPPIPIRYVDFAAWQRRAFAPGTPNAQVEYWRQALTGAPSTTEFPRARPSGGDRRGEMELVHWPARLAREVEEFSRRESATPFMTMLAVFSEIMRRHTGRDDVVVGTPIALRDQVELENVVGFLVNTLPLRTRPTPGLSYRDLLPHVRDVTIDAQMNRGAPLEAIIQALGLDRQASGNPLFGVSFIVQDRETQVLRLPGLDVSMLHGHGGTAKFALIASFVLLEDELRCGMEYDTSVFDRDYITDLIEEMRTLLQEVVAAPDRPMAELGEGAPR